MTQAPPAPQSQAPARTPQQVRTPLPPPSITPQDPDAGVESVQLVEVMPDSSPTFDPFTYGRPGSPYGPGQIFRPGVATRCGPMNMPMSSEFADPGDKQAVILIAGDGLECTPDIDHDKAGAAITFPLNSAIFINAPWSIVNQTTTTVTITNGAVTLRFTFRITSDLTYITRVEYL